MGKWWTGAALTAVWLLQTATAQAQPLPANEGNCMPEPLPYAAPPSPPAGPPQFPTGPVSPLPADLALPASIPNAWDERYCNFPAFYSYVGSMGLVRTRMGRGAVVLAGPAGDTGAVIPADSPVAQSLHDLAPKLNWGVRATVGYHWDDQAFELSGFYLFDTDIERIANTPGRLNSYFINLPPGFGGNDGLFRGADVISTGLHTNLASGEGNYHWWLGPASTFHWFIGCRYLDVQEHLRIFAADDVTAAGVSPLTQATYAMRVHNRIVGPQLGFEANKGLTHWLAFSAQGKAGFGANITDRTVTLTRGDGRLGLAANDDNVIISHFYEAGLYLDWCLAPHARLRTGYNVLFLCDIDRAEDKISYDLAHPLFFGGRTGDTFYHGPTVELQVVF